MALLHLKCALFAAAPDKPLKTVEKLQMENQKKKIEAKSCESPAKDGKTILNLNPDLEVGTHMERESHSALLRRLLTETQRISTTHS